MKKENYKTLLYLLTATILFIFTRTTTFVPVAIFVAPILFLRFTHSEKKIKSIVLIILGFVVAIQVSLWGLFKTDLDNSTFITIMSLISNIILALILVTPYVLERLLYQKFKSFKSTFILPVCAVTIYFLNSIYGPMKGTAIFYAFAQYGNIPFLQVLSLTGLWGSVFLILWTVSVINWVIEKKFEIGIIKNGLITYVVIMVLIFIYGGLKTSPLFYEYEGKTVRVAGILLPKEINKNRPGSLKVFNDRSFSNFNKYINLLEKQVKLAKAAGAKFAVFQEYYILIEKINEDKLLSELKRIAKQNEIYICFDYGYLPEMEDREHEFNFGFIELNDNEEGRNIAVLINTQGKIEIKYIKHNLAAGENNWILEGEGKVNVVNTQYGNVGVVICKDMDFPKYMIQAAKQNADIILAPSLEAVKSLSVTHSQMLRAVEYGFSFVRVCDNGLSIAIDKHGKVLSSMNSFTANNSIMYADVPVKGTRTVYSYIGDLFAWINVIMFGYFLVSYFIVINNKKVENY